MTDEIPVLEVAHLDAGYGSVPVLRNVSITVRKGEAVALLGANGAGKSTLLRAISNLINIRKGTVLFEGDDLRGAPPHRIARNGLAHVPEGRRLFAKQTVEDNLRLGMYGTRLTKEEEAERMELALDTFPILRSRLQQHAGLLSGGQQQMLVIGQALVRRPRLMMLDEPSLGLAPVLIDEVFAALTKVREDGGTVLLVEQLADRALRFADRAYVMAHGHITAEGDSATLVGSAELERAYLGDTPAGAGAARS